MPSDVPTAITDALAAKGISQRELARRLGWSVMKAHRRIKGDVEISITDLEKIAAALDVAVSTFLVDTESEGKS